MLSTIGRSNTRVALELFDSVVASVYRYGLGVWGVTVAHIRRLDDLFADFIRWLFRFPRTTGRDVILASFARRCGKCDSLYLASVQLATASTTRNDTWRDAVAGMRDGTITSKWYGAVESELVKRGLRAEVLDDGASFLGDRKTKAVEFSQYCFHLHLNSPTGTSADQLKRCRPFGIFPFLALRSSEKSRFIFAFLCSNWRFIDGLKCQDYPSVCEECDQDNTSFHVLFRCPVFQACRRRFFDQTGQEFCFEVFSAVEVEVQMAICDIGREIFFEIARRCERPPTTAATPV
jgi:hypothetical protein